MQPGRKSASIGLFFLGILVVAAAGGYLWTVWKGKQETLGKEEAARAAQLAEGPTLSAATAAMGPSMRRLVLVGELRPWREATLYAKVSGYLTRVNVDFGDAVKAGQVLAEMSLPEVDHQLQSATSTLQNARALLARTRDLEAKGFYSRQALEDVDTAVKVDQARLAELRAMSDYRLLKAPFAGVVTARFADPGVLLQAATSNATSSQPVLTVADVTRLKVVVYADQGDAPKVHTGLDAEVIDAADPTRRLSGKVARVSGQLDPRTRTLPVEVDIDNAAGQAVAGSFVNCALLLPVTSALEVPASALVVRDKKTQVGLLTADGNMQLRPIVVGSTDGKVLRIASGLSVGDRVLLNVPNSLADGGKVKVAAAAPMAAPAPAPAPAPMAAPMAAPAPAAPAPAAKAH